MSIARSIFRPGKGQVPQKFIRAFWNAATAGYRGDTVIWDIEAPASQGASGVLEGKTLGTDDFIYVTISATTVAGSFGRVAGVIEGPSLGSKDTATAIPDDSCVIVQTWGVHDNVRTNPTTGAAGSLLYLGTVAGALEVSLATDVATDVLITPATDTELGHLVVGLALTASATYTRGSVTTEDNVTAFIRCDN